MRVLIINPKTKGGSIQNTYFLGKALSSKDVEFAVVVDKFKNEIDFFNPKFKIYRELIDGLSQNWLSRKINYSKNKQAILKIIDEYRPDVVHFENLLNPAKDAEFINYIQNKGRKKIKVVYTASRILPYEVSPKDKKHFARIYNTVDKIIVRAFHSQQELSAVFGIPKELISVIPYGNAIELAKKSPEMTSFEARETLGLEKDAFHLLFFGNISQYRGLDTLLKAMLYLKDYPKIKLIVAGEMQDKKLTEDLIDILKIRDSVNFYLEYIPIKYVGQYFYASDLVVLPYKNVYQSSAMQLAFAFSRPVLTTKLGGISEVIRENENGWLAVANNPKVLAEGILKLYKAPRDFLDNVGRNAFKIAKTEYSWEYIAEEIFKVYE